MLRDSFIIRRLCDNLKKNYWIIFLKKTSLYKSLPADDDLRSKVVENN